MSQLALHYLRARAVGPALLRPAPFHLARALHSNNDKDSNTTKANNTKNDTPDATKSAAENTNSAKGPIPDPKPDDEDMSYLTHIKVPPPGFEHFARKDTSAKSDSEDDPVAEDPIQASTTKKDADNAAQDTNAQTDKPKTSSPFQFHSIFHSMQQQQQQKQKHNEGDNQQQKNKHQHQKNNQQHKGDGSAWGNMMAWWASLPSWQQNLAVAFVALNVGIFMTSDGNSQIREIGWNDLARHIQHKEVARLEVINRSVVHVYLKSSASTSHASSAATSSSDSSGSTFDDHTTTTQLTPNLSGGPSAFLTIGSVGSFEANLEETQKNLGLTTKDFVPVIYSSHTNWGLEAMKLLPTVAIIGFWIFMSRRVSSMGGGSNLFGFGQMANKQISKEISVKTNFSNIAGLDEAKVEVMEFVEFLKRPKQFLEIGAKIPKGALLVGPPGTGKTLLAKAVAGEAEVPFFSVSGSDFVEMFVGVGPSRVRDLFAQARESTPCIVFIDEIDAIGRKRGGGRMRGNDERENTLNQILVEMDGFSSSHGVIVLAATNRPELLDDALLRPGRFDRRILVDSPDLKGRKQIFEVHLKPLKLHGNIEEVAKKMAARCPGFVGADIANVCNEAALIAARTNKDAIHEEDFEAAIDRVIAGIEKKHRILSQKERTVVAYHEAGHAVCGWYLEHASPLVKVTIVPRGSGALGYAQYQPNDQYIYTKPQLLDRMCMTLGGRAAEEVFFERITTGAQDDLQKVTDLAYGLATQYAMLNTSQLGLLSFPPQRDSSNDLSRPYSQATAKLYDAEVSSTVQEAYKRTVDLIRMHKEDVEKVAKLLLERDVLMHEDMTRLLGPRPFDQPFAYDDIIARSNQDKADAKQ